MYRQIKNVNLKISVSRAKSGLFQYILKMWPPYTPTTKQRCFFPKRNALASSIMFISNIYRLMTSQSACNEALIRPFLTEISSDTFFETSFLIWQY